MRIACSRLEAMRCYEIQKFGLDGLAVAERPDPAPGPGEVLVKVGASCINFRDFMMLQGLYNPKQKLPLIPNSDGAGTVAAVGPGVARFKVGDRVAGIFSQGWHSGPPVREKMNAALGSPLDGMLTELRVLSQDGLVHTPKHLSDEEAACLPCAGVTAWSALVEHGEIKPGDTVLLQGTGGVSIFALQFAKLAGARVIITSSSDEKLERARGLGADETINYKTTPDWDKKARELTGGAGVDHIVEVGGGGTFGKSLRAVRIGGTISVIGVLSGATTDTSLIPVLMQNLRLQGIMVGSREMFEHMNAALSLSRTKPIIDRVFPFDEAPQAFAHMGSGAHFGKIVIKL
jgi:NADPH:quinone reductase-like Zn-dependent oxidoreductase